MGQRVLLPNLKVYRSNSIKCKEMMNIPDLKNKS